MCEQINEDGDCPAAPFVAAPRVTSLAVYLQRAIPIFVPAFNNPTYVRNMVDQLRARDLSNIVVVDNASTYPGMRALLESDFGATVVRLESNSDQGARHIFMDDESFFLLPELFCVTDPDLELNPHLPPDFLARLVGLTEQFQIGKAGFSLDISDPEAMHDGLFDNAGTLCRIWEWERQFWTNPIGELDGCGVVYRAMIDTTFAVYNKKYFRREAPFEAVRVAGVFTCRHLPWYRDSRLPLAEEEFYRRTAKVSTYLKPRNPPAEHLRSSSFARSRRGKRAHDLKGKRPDQIHDGSAKAVRLAEADRVLKYQTPVSPNDDAAPDVILYVVGGTGSNRNRAPREFPLVNRPKGQSKSAHLERVVQLVEEAMAAGGTHLRVPRERADWLGDHPLVAEYFAQHHEMVDASAETGIVFALRP